MTTAKRKLHRIDPRLADIIHALRLHTLLPSGTKRAVARLRTQGANRARVLREALLAILPPEVLPSLFEADGVEARGDWLAVSMSLDARLVMLDALVQQGKLGDGAVGVALAWRLAFFELATRIGAASFARDPAATPTLRHDLWAVDGGFGHFLELLFREHELTRVDVVDALVIHRLASDDVQKSWFDRWYYEDRAPQADSINVLARGIAVAAGRKGDEALITTLRMRIHLFVGARNAHGIVSDLVGRERAQTLAAAFAKQVHASIAAFRRSAAAPPVGPSGPVAPDAWLDERRRCARSAALLGVLPGSQGRHLLLDTHDFDLAMLISPSTSELFDDPNGLLARAMEVRHPGYIRARQGLRELVRNLTLDDCVSDASGSGDGRQPLSIVGLLERVLGMRLPL